MSARVDWRRLAEDMHMACLRRDVSQRDIAHEIGIAPSGLSRLRRGKALSADAVAALVSWLYPNDPKPRWITNGDVPDSRIDMEFP